MPPHTPTPPDTFARIHGNPYQRSFAERTATLSEEARDPTVGSVARAYAAGLARQRWDERIGGDSRPLALRSTANANRVNTKVLRLGGTMEDPLTGGNRRAFDQRLVHECESLSPQYDDRHGDHRRRPLQTRQRPTRRRLRRRGAVPSRSDPAIRSSTRGPRAPPGGDEFCAVITGASPQVVQERADQIGTLVILEDWESWCEDTGCYCQCRSRISRSCCCGRRSCTRAPTPPRGEKAAGAADCSGSRSDQRRGQGGVGAGPARRAARRLRPRRSRPESSDVAAARASRSRVGLDDAERSGSPRDRPSIRR